GHVTILAGRLDRKQFTVVLTDEACRRQHIELACGMGIVEKVRHMSREHRLDRVSLDQLEQPSTPRLVNVVVVGGFVGYRDERRVVHKEKSALAPCACQFMLEPVALFLLCRDAAIDERGVDNDKVADVV